MLAPKPNNQDQRLSTLDAYDILDTEAEPEFDDIVALASQICDVPVSLISLVDDDRQWFKSSIGFEPTQTPLDQSVCSHAILEDDILEINDMSKDERTKDNALHTDGPKVNFYAGANLVAPNGMPIGTLCVLDTQPRELTELQRLALRTLSRQVMTQLELRKKLRQEETLRQETDHRVKNSLQTISSILRMSARQVSDPVALDILGLVERRLHAVSSLHSELMSKDGAGKVNVTAYLDRVGQLMSELCPDNVHLTWNGVDLPIEASKASAVGMIVSEFTANSVKHAFPDNQNGRIDISLTQKKGAGWLLTCQDDGVGQDGAKTDTLTSTGLGEMLMSSAAAQLGGSLMQEAANSGMKLSITFPT
jgi:two-component sensor histidine kinase